MVARSVRWVVCLSAVSAVLSGCGTTCCNWWGRNSDCSPVIGKKPEVTTQAGPLASTYSRPGGGNTVTPLMQQPYAPNGNALPNGNSPPVVTTSPAATFQGTLNNSPSGMQGLPTPPGPLNSTISPSNYQPPGANLSLNRQSLPVAELNPAPEVKVTTPQVAMPTVQPPNMNFSMPGTTVTQTGAGSVPETGTPMPMVLAPASASAPPIPPATPIPPPQVGAVPEIKMPTPSNNPVVPPLPPPPSVPTLDKN